jgi:hypothetical protein
MLFSQTFTIFECFLAIENYIVFPPFDDFGSQFFFSTIFMFLHHMASNVATSNFHSFINHVIHKSQFLDFNERKLDNVKNGGQRANKHVELWANNAFNEWRKF